MSMKILFGELDVTLAFTVKLRMCLNESMHSKLKYNVEVLVFEERGK